MWPFSNPARQLASIGHAKRARTARQQRELLVETTDALREKLGLPPMQWGRRS